VDGVAERRECGLEVQTSQVCCVRKKEKERERDGDLLSVEKEIKGVAKSCDRHT
jgi:hypothetical protein